MHILIAAGISWLVMLLLNYQDMKIGRPWWCPGGGTRALNRFGGLIFGLLYLVIIFILK